jgi:hypothetical protein
MYSLFLCCCTLMLSDATHTLTTLDGSTWEVARVLREDDHTLIFQDPRGLLFTLPKKWLRSKEQTETPPAKQPPAPGPSPTLAQILRVAEKTIVIDNQRLHHYLEGQPTVHNSFIPLESPPPKPPENEKEARPSSSDRKAETLRLTIRQKERAVAKSQRELFMIRDSFEREKAMEALEEAQSRLQDLKEQYKALSPRPQRKR